MTDADISKISKLAKMPRGIDHNISKGSAAGIGSLVIGGKYHPNG